MLAVKDDHLSVARFSDIGFTPKHELSESVIPSVPGEFYAYSSEFTIECPLYVMMKCKASKARSITDAGRLGREANALFVMNGTKRVCVYSAQSACELNLLAAPRDAFGKTRVVPVDFTGDDFYELCSQRNLTKLVEICQFACAKSVSAELVSGSVAAVMTDDGKYGLFLVKKITPVSILVDACHILL